MALPVRPAGGLPVSRPTPPPAEALPELPALPELELPEPEKPAPRAEAPVKPQARPGKPAEVKQSQPTTEEDDRWEVDPLTGKRYKRIAGYKKGVMSSKRTVSTAGKRGFSKEELLMVMEDEPDFHLDDLNGSAETFLAHLRVAPDKEEQEKLRRERAERQKLFDAAAARAAEEEKESEEDF